MKTALELAMDTLISSGWATCHDGDVESPTGYFSVVPIDGAETADGIDLGMESDEVEALKALRHGWYLVVVDSQGFTHLSGPETEAYALMWADEREREYAAWSGEGE